MAKLSYDALIIGGGHMGLTLGAYLQRAGMQVAVFERRHEEGSAIFTSECTAPGFLHNLHAQYMEFIDWMPFYHDFELEKLGARCLYPEAQAGIAFSDGRPPIVLYSVENPENLERSRKSILVYSRQDADTYVELRRKALEMQHLLAASLYNPPKLPSSEDPDPDNTGSIITMMLLGLPSHYAKGSVRSLIDSLFESPELRALLYRMAVEWSTPLEMMHMAASGLISLFTESVNWRLMIGGTHTLAHAMVMAGVKEGMHFYESSEVVKILIRDGRAWGIRLKDGTDVEARKLVASNADIKATLLGLVGEENLSPLWAKRVRDFKIGPSCVLASTAMALHDAPDYKSARYNPDINKTFYTVVGFDTPQEVLEYCRDAEAGRIPRIPGAGTWVNSLWDPSYAPPGKHSLCGWFFFPKASSQTRDQWEEVRRTYNEKFLERFRQWAPNMTRKNVLADYFYTPLDQQDEMRLMEGDFMNGAMRPDQMGANRPFPEAAHYRTEIPGLYLCGPYMYPGGGASSATGYNAFKIIAEDFGLEKFWEAHPRGY
ncbi:MAG: NAD(P)/FAD-dependent oxidoreductase [Deltaproteobacteria bacterium]|nr:NAD(P)/FAD-dependent oxidoreductase [Deltaproteobacteria bacterium]